MSASKASPSGSAIARFALSPAEYAEGMRVIMRRQPQLWIGPVAGAIVLVAGVAIVAPVVIFAGLMVNGFSLWSFYMAPKVRYRQNARLHLDQVHTFSGTGISVRAGKEYGQLPWGFYRRAVETKNVYVLMRTNKEGNFIPKRAFASDQEQSRFRDLVADHMPARWLSEA
jgi:hypothetical protein